MINFIHSFGCERFYDAKIKWNNKQYGIKLCGKVLFLYTLFFTDEN